MVSRAGRLVAAGLLAASCLLRRHRRLPPRCRTAPPQANSGSSRRPWCRSASSGGSPATTTATRRSTSPTARRASSVAHRPAAAASQHESVGDNSADRATAHRRSVQVRGAEHVRRQHPQPRAGHRIRSAASCCPIRTASSGASGKNRHRAHPQGAAAGRGRPRLPRLSGRLERPEAGAGVHRPDGGLLHGRMHSDYENTFPPRVQAGRHHPGARRHLHLATASTT